MYGKVYKSNVSLQSGPKTSTFTEHTPSAWERGEDVQPPPPPPPQKTHQLQTKPLWKLNKIRPPIFFLTITNSLLALHSWEKDKKN